MHPINWLYNWLVLVVLFAWEMVKSVYDVLLNVLNPHRITQSAIVEVPLDVKSDFGVALLANMITLTPGTTTLHVTEDKKFLYAHVMNYAESEVEGIKQGFEHHMLKVLR